MLYLRTQQPKQVIEAVRTVLRSVTEHMPYCKSRSEDLNLIKHKNKMHLHELLHEIVTHVVI